MQMHTLQLRTEFEKVLKNYHVSDAGQGILKRARLALMIGLSASGRDTIISQLVEGGNFRYIASDTTRPPRINNNVHEEHGREYWFRSEEDFLADLQAGKLLEAEIIHNQQVSGISIRELQKCVEQDKIGVTNVDLNIEHIVSVKPDTRAILVVPPSFDEWMRRLDGRGEMSDVEKQRRYKTAHRILSAVQGWDFIDIVINDVLDDAVHDVATLASGGRQHSSVRDEHLQVVAQLLSDVDAHLKTLGAN